MFRRTLICTALLAAQAWADAPTIEGATATRSGNSWRFDVTIRHPDTGRDHYADGWRILAMDGTELGMRTLHHPHVAEQPFTRSLGGVTLPAGTEHIRIQARCSVDGWSAATITLALP